mmetsp:Transcript_5457/g.16230  ORF Transcript_5457/g.16230 Transcript_5457/m.16230 type:complete len:446 (-) Transcript_5457:1071-2408(-)
MPELPLRHVFRKLQRPDDPDCGSSAREEDGCSGGNHALSPLEAPRTASGAHSKDRQADPTNYEGLGERGGEGHHVLAGDVGARGVPVRLVGEEVDICRPLLECNTAEPLGQQQHHEQTAPKRQGQGRRRAERPTTERPAGSPEQDVGCEGAEKSPGKRTQRTEGVGPVKMLPPGLAHDEPRVRAAHHCKDQNPLQRRELHRPSSAAQHVAHGAVRLAPAGRLVLDELPQALLVLRHGALGVASVAAACWCQAPPQGGWDLQLPRCIEEVNAPQPGRQLLLLAGHSDQAAVVEAARIKRQSEQDCSDDQTQRRSIHEEANGLGSVSVVLIHPRPLHLVVPAAVRVRPGGTARQVMGGHAAPVSDGGPDEDRGNREEHGGQGSKEDAPPPAAPGLRPLHHDVLQDPVERSLRRVGAELLLNTWPNSILDLVEGQGRYEHDVPGAGRP